MRVKDVEPTVTPGAGGHIEGSYTERHPAYAQIGASRVSANPGVHLYGSDFRHASFVMVRIGTSELKRDLSHDWHYSSDEYIEVALSEAQWATFVSTLNMGQGTPCTLTRRDGALVPGITRPKSRVAQFSAEATETLNDAKQALAKLHEQIEASGLSAKAKKDLLDTLRQAENNLAPNLAYVAKCFSEHVEATTEKAKIEVSAYVSGVIARTGLEVLRGAVQTPIALPEDEK